MMTLVDPAGNPLEIFHDPQIDTHRPFHPAGACTASSSPETVASDT